MLRPRFYTAQSLSQGAALTLEVEPSRHIARALRMRAGDVLCLFDGSGREAPATISAIDRDRVTVQLDVVATADRESPLAITLAVGLSRGDRMDLIVQKATELGAAAIRPIITERSGVRLAGDRLEKKIGHWQRIVVSACEQCGRNRLPPVVAPQALADFLDGTDEAAQRFILHPAPAEEHTGAAGAALDQDGPAQGETPPTVCLLVGPEGGFSDREVSRALAAGFRALQLGPRILRTETAPLAALAVLQARWGDLRFP